LCAFFSFFFSKKNKKKPNKPTNASKNLQTLQAAKKNFQIDKPQTPFVLQKQNFVLHRNSFLDTFFRPQYFSKKIKKTTNLKNSTNQSLQKSKQNTKFNNRMIAKFTG